MLYGSLRLFLPPLLAQESGRLGRWSEGFACRLLLPVVHGWCCHWKMCTHSVLVVSVSERTQPVWGLRFHLSPLHQERPFSVVASVAQPHGSAIGEECSSASSQLSPGGSGHAYVLCRVSAPFSWDICGHSCSHLLKKKVVLTPEQRGDSVPCGLCDSGPVGAVVPCREDGENSQQKRYLCGVLR